MFDFNLLLSDAGFLEWIAKPLFNVDARCFYAGHGGAATGSQA